MLVKDIMTTQVVTVMPHTVIKEAIKLLVEIEISGLIVTDETSEIVGVVSERDFLVAYDFLHQTNAPISDFINRNIISVTEDATVEEVSRILVEKNVKRVPVIDGKKVVGVVSRRDVLKYILKNG